jgi:hypothetical protein
MRNIALVIFVCVSLQFLATLVDSSGQELLEGDIVPSKNRNAILAAKRWTNGVVPWEFSKDGNWGQKHRDMLAKVMREIQEHTCIQFVPYTNQPNYVRIINGTQVTGCYAMVGQEGGMQEVSLAESSSSGSTCWSHGIVTHELFHMLGLWHEQQRYDRDDYIKVYFQNVAKSLRYSIEARLRNETDTYGVPYDYYSVMHYSKKSFSKNGRTTMRTLDLKMMDVIGRQDRASENDYELLRRVYGCKGSYPSQPPNPAPPPVSPADLHICEDEIDYCDQQLDKCGKEDWTKTFCKRSCGFCTYEDDCQDEYTYCDQLAKDCSTYETVRETYCRKTCKTC